MKITIENMVERVAFLPQGKKKLQVEVFYQTDKGYRGQVTLDKDGLTQDKIKAAIKEAAEVAHKAIGITFE